LTVGLDIDEVVKRVSRGKRAFELEAKRRGRGDKAG